MDRRGQDGQRTGPPPWLWGIPSKQKSPSKRINLPMDHLGFSALTGCGVTKSWRFVLSGPWVYVFLLVVPAQYLVQMFNKCLLSDWSFTVLPTLSDLNPQFPPLPSYPRIVYVGVYYHDEFHWVEKVLASQTAWSPAGDFWTVTPERRWLLKSLLTKESLVPWSPERPREIIMMATIRMSIINTYCLLAVC